MIRFAEKKDISSIQKFIDEYWKKNHILSRDKDFFEYEHLIDDKVTYVLSVDDHDNINAILGYIPYGKSHFDAMTVMWKSNHEAGPTVGLELFNYLKQELDVRILASPGSNKKLKGFYSFLGYKFGKMNHWYRLHEQAEYRIAEVKKNDIPKIKSVKDLKWMKLDKWSEFEEQFDYESYLESEPKPLKEKWYIEKRYYRHPIYKYRIYGIGYDKAELVLVLREQDYNGRKVLRLVDCIGKMSILSSTGYYIDQLLDEIDAEYVDCYETGVDSIIMSEAGFLLVDGSDNIIPNYFAPFVKENIDIYYFSSDDDVILFKGDGDQDRPN